MGKISSEPEKETHFSHPHPLNKLITDHHQTLTNSSSSCSGCNLKPSGVIYSCATCNFFLHKKCFEMPKKITHHFHKEHALTLLPEPAYPDGLFRCDACAEAGKGFSYHCKPCGVDLHILCAATPLSVAHASHAHKLELAFQPPYPTKDFACDVCRSPGADHWLYRCNPCGFDAHLSCVHTMVAPPPPFAAEFSRSVPVPPQGFGAPPPPPMHHNFMARPMMNNPAVGVPVGGTTAFPFFGVSRQNDASVLQAIQQRVSNNQALTQAIMAGNGGGGVGGGGGLGGGGLQLQQMMQMISSFNNNSGGVVPGLNIFGGGGGGGGGQDMLQSLFSGGGGGNGLDFLGGGGLDFLGALGG